MEADIFYIKNISNKIKNNPIVHINNHRKWANPNFTGSCGS